MVLRRRQQHRGAFPDHERMLVMRRGPVIRRDHRPFIRCDERPSRSRRDNRFDGYHQAFRENLIRLRIGLVWHSRFFMDGASNAVAAQIANHGKSAAPHFTLDGSTDF